MSRLTEAPKDLAATPTRLPDVVPLEAAGKFVARTPDGLRIVVVADTFEEAHRLAAEKGYPRVAVARSPRGYGVD